MSAATILHGDALAVLAALPDASVQCCVTSPPYWGLRDYGADGQLGLESTPEEYIARMVAIFREVRRVLRGDGTCWLNLGDSYANNGAKDSSKVGGFTGQRIRDGRKGIMDSRPRDIPAGLKPKDLCMIPARVAIALQADGWYLRSEIIWHKPNPMPESVTDRPTKAHEMMYLLTKSPTYFYDADAIAEAATGRDPGNIGHKYQAHGIYATDSASQQSGLADVGPRDTRNRRTVWTVATQPYTEAHFAVFPPDLIRPCVLAGSRPGDVVLDPFNGSGTTGQVALEYGRDYIGIELNAEYIALTHKRLARVPVAMMFGGAL